MRENNALVNGRRCNRELADYSLTRRIIRNIASVPFSDYPLRPRGNSLFRWNEDVGCFVSRHVDMTWTQRRLSRGIDSVGCSRYE